MRITVLTGGSSAERDVALASASQVVAALRSRGHVVTVSGTTVPLAPETLCVHGDRPNAPQIASAVRASLQAAGFTIRSAFTGGDL